MIHNIRKSMHFIIGTNNNVFSVSHSTDQARQNTVGHKQILGD